MRKACQGDSVRNRKEAPSPALIAERRIDTENNQIDDSHLIARLMLRLWGILK